MSHYRYQIRAITKGCQHTIRMRHNDDGTASMSGTTQLVDTNIVHLDVATMRVASAPNVSTACREAMEDDLIIRTIFVGGRLAKFDDIVRDRK